jgi:phenylacetate-CoA ligase
MAMPFIRYDIGDVGLLSEGPCPCGRATITLDRIDGRTEDFIRTPDGRMVVGLNQAFEWAPGVAATQVVQEHLEEISVLVVPGTTFQRADLTTLEYELRQRVGAGLRIKFEVVESIPLSNAGKYRAVISRIPVHSDAEREQRTVIERGLDA